MQFSFRLLFFVFTGLVGVAFAQYPPEAGMPGSTALHKDSSCFLYFANNCMLHPGYLDRSQPGLGRLPAASAQAALGRPDGLALSLGDSGWVQMDLNTPLFDDAGFDFAVFENSFSDHFLELAFVEVSSDGIHFLRFPSVSLTGESLQQGPFDDTMDPRNIHHLAGKYRALFGTPFDLSELPDSSWLNKDSIVSIRVVDVTGSIQPAFGSYDSQGHLINDPFPTPFPTGGFDLDGVGFIHARYTGLSPDLTQNPPFFYPNAVSAGNTTLQFPFIKKGSVLSVYDASGHLVMSKQASSTIEVCLSRGMYILQLQESDSLLRGKLLVE